MRLGSKKIYHLEAWVVKVMCLYKVRSSLLPVLSWLTSFSILLTTLICLNSTRRDSPVGLFFGIILCGNANYLI